MKRRERRWADLSSNATAKKPSCTARANAPVLDIIRVRPHEVYEKTLQILVRHASERGPWSILTAKCAFVWNFLRPRKNANLVESADVWREPPVDTEYFAVNDLPMRDKSRQQPNKAGGGWTHRSKVEVIEDITTCFPYRSATVLLLTLLSMRCRTTEECAGLTGRRTIKSINLSYLPTLVVSTK
jgi:hypothetical protein